MATRIQTHDNQIQKMQKALEKADQEKAKLEEDLEVAMQVAKRRGVSDEEVRFCPLPCHHLRLSSGLCISIRLKLCCHLQQHLQILSPDKDYWFWLCNHNLPCSFHGKQKQQAYYLTIYVIFMLLGTPRGIGQSQPVSNQASFVS